MKLKEMFENEIEEQYQTVIAPQSEKQDIPSSESIFGNYYGDNDPAF